MCARAQGGNAAAHSEFLHQGRCWLINQGRRWPTQSKTISGWNSVPAGVVERKKVMSSSYTQSSSAPAEVAAYGGPAHPLRGIATVVLAILAPAGGHPENIFPIAGVLFGAAPLYQGAALAS